MTLLQSGLDAGFGHPYLLPSAQDYRLDVTARVLAMPPGAPRPAQMAQDGRNGGIETKGGAKRVSPRPRGAVGMSLMRPGRDPRADSAVGRHRREAARRELKFGLGQRRRTFSM